MPIYRLEIWLCHSPQIWSIWELNESKKLNSIEYSGLRFGQCWSVELERETMPEAFSDGYNIIGEESKKNVE